MILVEAGGTKTDWVVGGTGPLVAWSGAGLNPVYTQPNEIVAFLKTVIAAHPEWIFTEQIVWYGAGCATPFYVERLRQALGTVFERAEILIYHDLLAVAHAACWDQPGLIGILGTGSNAAYYDGSDISEQRPNLGYLLGDEGSGYDIGRSLLRAYFFGQLGTEASMALGAHFPEGRATLLKSLYESGSAKPFVAQFSKIAHAHQDDPAVQLLIRDCLSTYVATYFKALNNRAPVHLVGSVAYSFRESLQTVIEDSGLEWGSVAISPLAGLKERYFDTTER